MRLLIVEDEPQLNNALYQLLKSEQYAVDCCYDGMEAKDYLSAAAYDAVVLDIMLPKLSGLALLKELRREGNNTPVLLLTARDSIEDRVAGLDAGANDYLVKPFANEELLARVRVLLRNSSNHLTNTIQIADLTIDTATRQVFRAGREVYLSGKEYAILSYLARNQGIVLSRQRIEDHIWNYDYVGGSNVVDVYIRKLRKLVDEGHDKKLIHTVRNMGYVLREQP